MPSINAISRAPAVKEWLANSHQPRILHIFDHACNLINERRDVLAIVTPQIGDGPFNLVLEKDICFSDTLDVESIIGISPNQLAVDALTINMAKAILWNPRPNWESLRAKRHYVFKQVSELEVTNAQIELFTALAENTHLLSTLSSALAQADLSSARQLAVQLAGSGIGLTPAGDDVLMGAMYAVWIIHPVEVASVLAQEIANTAAPLTTSLSAAWLRSAGRGEVGGMWHRFFDALLSSNGESTQDAVNKILSVGHTSGADALVGFSATLAASLVSVESIFR